MTPTSPDTESTLSELLQELNALRGRLDQAPTWFRRPPDSMKAGALAEEAKRLCREASLSQDNSEVADLLASARHCLDQLQALLGSH